MAYDFFQGKLLPKKRKNIRFSLNLLNRELNNLQKIKNFQQHINF